MPKLTVEDEELDIKAMEEAEVGERRTYSTYDGPEPPDGTILPGYIDKVWWTWTQEKPDGSGNDPMLKVIFVADESAGKYAGCTIWDQIVLNPASKWRWFPFLEALGLDIRTVKTKTYVESEPDNVGDVVEKIGTWRPGEDSDEAYCRAVKGHHFYQKDRKLDIQDYLVYEEGLGGDAAEDEPEEPEDEVVEEVEPEEPPTRGRGRAAKAASNGGAAKPATRSRASAGGRNAAKASTGKAASGGRGRGRSRASDGDEPPF